MNTCLACIEWSLRFYHKPTRFQLRYPYSVLNGLLARFDWINPHPSSFAFAQDRLLGREIPENRGATRHLASVPTIFMGLDSTGFGENNCLRPCFIQWHHRTFAPPTPIPTNHRIRHLTILFISPFLFDAQVNLPYTVKIAGFVFSVNNCLSSFPKSIETR